MLFAGGMERVYPPRPGYTSGFASLPSAFHLQHQLVSRELLSWQPLKPGIYSAKTGRTLMLETPLTAHEPIP